jgi:hypothetical protein
MSQISSHMLDAELYFTKQSNMTGPSYWGGLVYCPYGPWEVWLELCWEMVAGISNLRPLNVIVNFEMRSYHWINLPVHVSTHLFDDL